VFKPWVLRRFDNRLGGRIAVHRMDPLDSFQVDEPADVELVERLMRIQAAVAQPGGAVDVDASTVGAPVRQDVRHALQQSVVHRPSGVEVQHPHDSAHGAGL